MINGVWFTEAKSMQRILAMSLLLFVAPATALVAIPKNYAQLVDESEIILIGTVTHTEGVRRESRVIVTDVTLTDIEFVKGRGTDEMYTVRMLGGTVGDETMTIAGAPTFQHGWRYLLFIKGNGTVMFPIVGADQGIFSIQRDDATGEEHLYTAHGRLVVDIHGDELVTHSSHHIIPDEDRTLADTPLQPLSLNTMLADIRKRVD